MNSEPAALLAPPTDWRPICSGQQSLSLALVRAAGQPALRLDYDFRGQGGFVVARCDWRRPMPSRYALRFRLRGSGAANDLEVKLVDASKHNVWRRVLKAQQPSARGRRYQLASHELDYGWGPAGGGNLGELGAIEIALVAGEGGSGRLWLSELEIIDTSAPEPWLVECSSAEAGHAGAQVLEPAGWWPSPGDARPWVQLDAGATRPLGGVRIDWLERAPASGFRLLGSRSGQRWVRLHVARKAGGRYSQLYLPNARLRYLRLELDEACAGLRLQALPPDHARSIDDYWHRRAQAEPRGRFPRWLLREQSLWTPIGSGRGRHCALVNEEGLVELDAGSCTVEAMLWLRGRLYTWADVHVHQSLKDGWQPRPAVTWSAEDWRLHLELEMQAQGRLRLSYQFDNLGSELLAARLFLVLRPYQVTPPWQRFRGLGGVSPIRKLDWRRGVISVNGRPRLRVVQRPIGFGVLSFDEGLITDVLAQGQLPADDRVLDPTGYANGALRYDLQVLAHGSAKVEVLGLPASEEEAGQGATDWADKLGRQPWQAAGWGAEAIRVARTACAHVLICRDGPALQAGPRRYTRSWIRDGATMSAALLRMGCVAEVGEFIRWYAPYQRADGFVPCCVDREGPDWLVEHDSHGQWLALIADHQRHGGEAALLEELWPAVRRTVDCIASLLDGTGLLPISASHEGYLAQPVHSYWDDFWALRGLGDAVYLAERRGDSALTQRWQALQARFAHNLYASLAHTRVERGLDYLPASLELADFDPTATANAVQLLGVPEALDRAALEQTFDRYLQGWRRQRDGQQDGANYSPYQIRIISALVRMGRRAQALELLRYFLAERQPTAWNQWPEIIWRDPRSPGHLGDLPHAWIAAEYLLALRSLYVYEQPDDQGLVLAAGLAPEWLDGEGVCFGPAPTVCGPLHYALRRTGPHCLEFEIEASGSLCLRPPLSGAIQAVWVDGAVWREHDHESVRLDHYTSPCRVRIETTPGDSQ